MGHPKTSAPGGGGKGGKKAGGASGKAKKKGGAGKGKGNKKKKQKEKLKCGEDGEYGDLKKKTGDNQFDRDHVPSKAALKERAQKLALGQKLCDKQKTAVDNAGLAIAIPKWAHQLYSPTYGSSNSPTQIKKDAKNLQTAARRDTRAMKAAMKKKGVSKECQKKYAAWAKKVNAKTPKQYDAMLKKAIGK